VRLRIESNNSVKDLVGKFSRNSTASRAFNQGQSRISFASLDSFDEVRRGFKFGPNGAAFYPFVSFSRDHSKHDSIFSIASVTSYGSVINNGAPDPFGYSRHNRPSSEDVSISMSMSVDDTPPFMYQKRHSRVDSDTSGFYFRSQPSVVGQIRCGHRAHDSVVSADLYPFIPKPIALLPQQRVKIGRQTNTKTVPAERNGDFDSKVLSRQHGEVWEQDGKVTPN